MKTLHKYWELRRCYASLKWACSAIQNSKTSEELMKDQNYKDLLDTITSIQITLGRLHSQLAQDLPGTFAEGTFPWSYDVDPQDTAEIETTWRNAA